MKHNNIPMDLIHEVEDVIINLKWKKKGTKKAMIEISEYFNSGEEFHLHAGLHMLLDMCTFSREAVICLSVDRKLFDFEPWEINYLQMGSSHFKSKLTSDPLTFDERITVLFILYRMYLDDDFIERRIRAWIMDLVEPGMWEEFKRLKPQYNKAA